MSDIEVSEDDVRAEAALALDRWQLAILNLKDGYSQRSCNDLYRSVHELKHLCKAFSLGPQQEFLKSLDETVARLMDRRLKLTDPLLDTLSTVQEVMDRWFTLEDDSMVSKEAEELKEAIEKVSVIRGFSKRPQGETKKDVFVTNEEIATQLVDSKKISPQQLEEAYELQRRTILQILLDMNLISEKDIEQTRKELQTQDAS